MRPDFVIRRPHMPPVSRGAGTVVVTVSDAPRRHRRFLSC